MNAAHSNKTLRLARVLNRVTKAIVKIHSQEEQKLRMAAGASRQLDKLYDYQIGLEVEMLNVSESENFCYQVEDALRWFELRVGIPLRSTIDLEPGWREVTERLRDLCTQILDTFEDVEPVTSDLSKYPSALAMDAMTFLDEIEGVQNHA